MPRTSSLPVLVNARAGRAGRDTLGVLARALGGAADPRIEVLAPESLAERAAELARAGEPRVAVAGGDGTLRSGASGLAGTDTALLSLPLGTHNHFARRCGIADLEDARRALLAGREHMISVGRVDGRLFLNTVSVGAYALLVRIRERGRGSVGRRAAQAAGLAAALASRSRMRVEVRTAEGTLSRAGVRQLWVGLYPAAWPVDDSLLTDPDAGRWLELALLSPSPLELAALLGRGLWKALRGQHAQAALGGEVLRTQRASLELGEERPAVLDGELTRLPARLSVERVPAGLRVLVPPERDQRDS